MKPRFKKHVCESECNCQVCRDYINKLDDHRQSISRGESKRKIIFRLIQTSELNTTSEGKGFDKPKPRLVRPQIMS